MAKGKVVQVIGTVVDVEYPPDELPALYNAIEIGSGDSKIVLEVQDHLGLMNDADVAATATREWLNLHAPHLPSTSREAVGLFLDSREAKVEQMRRSFKPVWRRLTGVTFRKALGLAITQIG